MSASPSSIRTLTAAGKTVHLIAGDCSAGSPLLLTFLTQSEAFDLAGRIWLPAWVAAVDESSWEQVFTPWSAPRAFKSSADFGGGADAYLAELTDALLPELQLGLELQPRWYGMAGFSLAGLFAAYAAYQNKGFTRIASVSGSLWYDGWTDYVQQHSLPATVTHGYFSVGDGEKNSRYPRFACVEDCTRTTVEAWRQRGVAGAFELNAGGHVADVAERMAKALIWLALD